MVVPDTVFGGDLFDSIVCVVNVYDQVSVVVVSRLIVSDHSTRDAQETQHCAHDSSEHPALSKFDRMTVDYDPTLQDGL